MGTFAGNTLIDELARRLRDTANIGYPRAVLLEAINRSQRSLNVRLGLVHNTATFDTVNTPLFDVDTIATDIARIVAVREDNRELTMVNHEDLVNQDRRWVRAVGRPQVFATFGRTLLAVIPIPVVPTTITVVYVKQTGDLADAGTPLTEIPDEHKPLMLDIAEAMMLFRGREFRAMQTVLERISPALGIENVVFDTRKGRVTRG